MCLDKDDVDIPRSNLRSNRPLRAFGTRFVSHKVVAMNRLIQRFGAYLAHLTTLTMSIEKAKLEGYLMKWRDFKIILGCALFHNLLKPASINFVQISNKIMRYL